MSTFTKLAAIAGASLMAIAGASAASAADVSLTLTGVKEGGTLFVSLQTEDQFMSMDGVAGEMMPISAAGDVTVTLGDVAPGTYAFSIWHDVNGNNEFDMSAQGWPEDGWSAYNVTSLFCPPSFSQVSFEVTEAGFSASEPMIYPEFYSGGQ